MKVAYEDKKFDLAFDFASNSKREVNISKLPQALAPKNPVFLPTRELLTIYPGFISLYEERYVEFEETWRDTCVLLGAPLDRGPKEQHITKLLLPLETSMGGSITIGQNTGHFYLKRPGQSNMEIQLVAEGLRKLGMVARLIATGALLEQGYLFWDEPEANLNPKLIKEAAKTVLHIASSGIQVFVATHSLFLMREIDILLQAGEFEIERPKFFGLHSSDAGYEVQQGDDIDSIGEIASLDEELRQSDRYLETGAYDEDH